MYMRQVVERRARTDGLERGIWGRYDRKVPVILLRNDGIPGKMDG